VRKEAYEADHALKNEIKDIMPGIKFRLENQNRIIRGIEETTKEKLRDLELMFPEIKSKFEKQLKDTQKDFCSYEEMKLLY